MFKAKLLKPEIDYTSGRTIIRAEVLEGNYREFYEAHKEQGVFSLVIKKWRQRRSKDANSYYHVLVNKIAEKLSVSDAEVKNMTIGRYGQLELDEDGKPIYMIVRDSTPVGMWEELHLRATDQTQVLNKILYRVYYVMRGSHTYNTKEMARLIDGTLSEAKEIGLTEAELMSPREKEMLEKQYGIEVAA